MARYCTWSTETPRFERCLNLAEPGGYRCSEHQIKKKKRTGDLTTQAKEAVRQRDGYRCVRCGAPAHEVNHIQELSTFAPEDKWRANLPSNLETLCFQHHAQETARFRKEQIILDDPDDTSTSARNRKRKRMRKQGFYF